MTNRILTALVATIAATLASFVIASGPASAEGADCTQDGTVCVPLTPPPPCDGSSCVPVTVCDGANCIPDCAQWDGARCLDVAASTTAPTKGHKKNRHHRHHHR